MALATPNILVVEDDRETRTLIAKYLRTNACNVTTANDGREMARAMADHRVDLLILDVMLPGEDGLSLCRKVRAESQTPIIMLTARGEDVDRILGLEMGADDYLAKPFNPRELLARIRAVLRRSKSGETALEPTLLRADGLELNTAARTVLQNGQRIYLTDVEFGLLESLLHAPGKVVTREELAENVLGRKLHPFDRSLDMHISRLRRKLSGTGMEDDRVKTIRGTGYQLVVHSGLSATRD